ncbi:hypothetical protein HY625_00290, partial [Candidatus Uhrbacteria bacterium]|nr:hypothetical protein [Candidatus Uhrbacteria bacterium]
FALFAAESFQYNFTIIPESSETILELVNLVFAVLTAAFAVKLAALSQGGMLEKTWNWMAIASVTFAVLEVVGALKGFAVANFEGLDDIIEFVMVLVLFMVFYRTRKDLLRKALGK